jgi:lactose/L-arabinose transport system permease protein
MLKINAWGWTFIAPAALLIIIMGFYPMVDSFILALHSGKGEAQTFTGLGNFIRLTKDPTFRFSLGNIFFYLLLEVPIMLVMALVLASLLNEEKLKFKGVYRILIFLPCATSLVSCSAVFRQFFSGDGLMNILLMRLKLTEAPINFLTHPVWAKIVIIIVLLWRWTGYNMIFYLAGLQSIDKNIYEAATIDGANRTQQFLKFTVPLLRPIIILTAILSTNGTLQIFDEVKNLTRGGPGNATISVSMYIYNLVFAYVPQFGYASAISYTVFFMVALLALIQMQIGERKQ